MDLGDGVQKFSLHWEADLDRGGASVLDIRPLLWKDGWPVAGENMKEGTYEIESVRTGTALELAVEGVPVGGRRAGRGGGIRRTGWTWRTPRGRRWTWWTQCPCSGRNRSLLVAARAWRIIGAIRRAGSAAGRCASFDELAYRRN